MGRWGSRVLNFRWSFGFTCFYCILGHFEHYFFHDSWLKNMNTYIAIHCVVIPGFPRQVMNPMLCTILIIKMMIINVVIIIIITFIMMNPMLCTVLMQKYSSAWPLWWKWLSWWLNFYSCFGWQCAHLQNVHQFRRFPSWDSGDWRWRGRCWWLLRTFDWKHYKGGS